MGKVVMYASVSVDGFVADENDQPGPLFDWLLSGDVPLDESGECGLVPMGRKLLEELTIRPPQAGLQRNQPTNVSDDRMQFRFSHCFGSP